MTSRHCHPHQQQRTFLRRILTEGADRLGVSVLEEEAVFGWHDRTIGAPALLRGNRYWIRATAEHIDWTCGEAWTGNKDANVIRGVPKPDLVDRAEWEDFPVCHYAELLTFIPDTPCSTSPELISPVALSSQWWTDLQAALDALAAQPTSRGVRYPELFVQELEAFYGKSLGLSHPLVLRTEHMDLHWGNLTQPCLCILDWEYWGNAPAGYGAAVLYLHSLLVPSIAAQVYDRFADLLDSPSGRVAQLSAAGLILTRAERSGDYPNLVHPVRAYAAQLLQPARRR